MVSVNGHVDDAGFEMRRRVEMLDSHQMWMPYMRARVVDAGGVVVTVEKERSGMGGRDGGLASDMDVLRMVPLNIKEGVLLINKIFTFTCPSCLLCN